MLFKSFTCIQPEDGEQFQMFCTIRVNIVLFSFLFYKMIWLLLHHNLFTYACTDSCTSHFEIDFMKIFNWHLLTVTWREHDDNSFCNIISHISSIRETKADLEHKSTVYNTLRRDHDELVISESSLKRRCQTLDDDLCASQQEVSGLKSSVATLTSTHAGTQAELEASRVIS